MINEAKKSDVKKMEKAANKIISDMKKLNLMFKKAHDPKTSMPAAYRTLQDWEYLVGQVDGQYGGWFEFVYDSDDYITEGTCGYGEDGELGDEPAGPHLLKKKNESVGSKKYNGRDWFWPHDYRHYLRDASPAQRKKIHDAWLKIGIPVKGTGLKISDRYLEPKKNQLKKAWTIVRKVVAPKELGMPIPEGIDTSRLKESSKEYGKSLDKIANDKKLKAISNKDKELLKKLAKLLQKESLSASQAKAAHDKFKKTGELPPHLKKLIKKIKKFEKDVKVKNIVIPGLEWMSKIKEAKYKGYDYKRQKRKDGLSLIVPALRKSFSNMKDLKKYIDKHGKMEGFNLEEACQKGYMTHPTRKTKIMFGKRYRNCVKKEGVDTTVTLEQAGMIADNICVNCGDFTNENLRKWFKDRWVNIGKKKKGGGHPPCGSSGKKRGYAKCVPKSKAANMTKKQKASATRRKRAAQNKAGRGGKQSAGQGKAPIRVSTKPKK